MNNTVNEQISRALDHSKAFHERYFRAYGQIIMRLDDNTFLMSNNNLRLSRLKASDFCVYDINSGDIGEIMRTRRDINAIVVMCTEASVLFSDKGVTMKPALDDLVQIIGRDVPVIADGKASSILKAIKTRNGCFVKGAGLIAVGSNLDAAIAGARILEKSAEAEMFADKFGGLTHLAPANIGKLKSFGDSYSKVNKDAGPPYINRGDEEHAMRKDLINAGIALSEKDLVQGTWGNLSVRLDDNTMLITPSGMNYHKLKIEDIVCMDIEALSYDQQRVPSSEYKLHAGIYSRYPECKAIIHTHSNGCSIFAAANAGFRIDAPELQDVIGDLHVSEYALPGTEALTESVMNALEGTHACIIANHGAIFYSESLELALAIANAVEDRACNLIGLKSTIGVDEEA